MKTKQDVVAWIEKNRQSFTDLSDQIWDFAEPAWKEFKSAKLQADFLAKKGFKIKWDLAGINTAFVAEWGSGKPVIGFAGEFDALRGLSQKVQTTQEELVPGGNGHGCGHNLLGVGCLAAALAAKEWLEATQTPGTVRYYGCPAEEGGSAKAFMAREGVFNDLAVAFNYHPGNINFASKGTAIGVNHLRFRFHGRAAHAGGAPHLGRSALDAVELMNMGVNYLREHVTSNVRMHYVISHGGDLPNIVPAEAEVWYYVRALKPDELEDVTNRVRKIAAGAAMMTETTWEEIFESASSAVLNNDYLADLQYEAMKLVGPIQYTEHELQFASEINSHFEPTRPEEAYKCLREKTPQTEKILASIKGKPILGDNYPSLDEGEVETGSTDVGDLSQVTPISMLNTACIPLDASGHSWG